jgi:hypothetical protein
LIIPKKTETLALSFKSKLSSEHPKHVKCFEWRCVAIPQDYLLLGLEVLAAPLTEVVNCSINTGIVLEAWK